MPKRKANWWPPSILSDPDVLSVDDEGNFVLCKICHVHYAVHGGKKPKPVIMNSNFRTRAWDVHKERTNSHRLQKQKERVQQSNSIGQQQQRMDLPGQQQPQTEQIQLTQVQLDRIKQDQTQQHSHSIKSLATTTHNRMQTPHLQVQGQQDFDEETPPRAPQQPHGSTHDLLQRRQVQDHERHQKRQQQDAAEIKDAGSQAQTAIKRSASASSNLRMAATVSGAHRTVHEGRQSSEKRIACTTPIGSCLIPRRRVCRIGLSRQHLAESDAASGAQEKENHLHTAPGLEEAVPIEQAVAMERQADSSARWRHMHDDVSRALNAATRKQQMKPSSLTSRELRAASKLAQTETGDLGGNNSERVAKKLRSLNAEYHASNMRYADAYNMRHSNVFGRSSPGYKEYWGTLRDVYTTTGTTSGGSGLENATSFRKSRHPPTQVESKETEADSTTPCDSGSSEDAFKPAVAIHDALLASAIERLTDATSSHIATLHQKGVSDTTKTLVELTTVMTDLRVQHSSAFERIIQLQEKQLEVMEGLLKIKLRKEAVRNNSDSLNSSNSGGGSTSSLSETITVSAQTA
ncbi:hypothetical protein CCR75_007152 [Bremia lactucae]|uniref:Uncharacterized protein n=1 Tax=Bremia lactucae TaxID=4779 RepID=A0A976FE75_BRELC|nr:hypothetical protein CCR75_007152 [Bremia lactucae]